MVPSPRLTTRLISFSTTGCADFFGVAQPATNVRSSRAAPAKILLVVLVIVPLVLKVLLDAESRFLAQDRFGFADNVDGTLFFFHPTPHCRAHRSQWHRG